MSAFVVLIIAAALASALAIVGIVAAARLLRLAIESVSFGFGPTLASFVVHRTTIRFKLLPFPSSVKLAGAHEELDDALRAFENRGRAEKIAMTLSGSAAGLIVAVAVLGPTAMLHAAAASWGEYFRVVTAFPDVAAPWQPIIETVRTESLTTTFGLVCAKVAALNLLPLAPLSGGLAIMHLCGSWDETGEPTGPWQLYFRVSVCIIFGVLLLWLIGAVRFVLAGG